MPGLGFAKVNPNKPILFIADIQPSLNFNIEGWRKMLSDVKQYAPFSAVVVIGDIYENVEMYREQYEKTFGMKVQHAVVTKLFEELANAAEPETWIFLPGNHDVNKFGEDLSLEIAKKMKEKGYKVGYASEMLLIQYNKRNILCIHRLGRSWGSQVASLTYTIYRNALELIQQIQRKYNMIIHDFVFGHIHRPVVRPGSLRFIVLGGWNRDRFFVSDPSTVSIMRPDYTVITLDYPNPLDLEENMIKMRRFAEECMKEYLSDISLISLQQDCKNNIEGGLENVFEKFSNIKNKKNNKELNKCVREAINEILKDLNWKVKDNQLIIEDNDEFTVDVLSDYLKALGIRYMMHRRNGQTYMKIFDIAKLRDLVSDENLKRSLSGVLS